MGKATPRDIAKSVRDHDLTRQDARDRAPQRHAHRGVSSYTSESPKQPAQVAGAFGKAQAEGKAVTYTTQGGHTKQLKDSRDRFWDSLGKQVAHGAGVRVNVRG